MGLAVLPARLKKEMSLLKDMILAGQNLYEEESLLGHVSWASHFLKKNGFKLEYVEGEMARVTAFPDLSNPEEKLQQIIKDEIGYVFSGVLEDSGVYKKTAEGSAAFMRFIDSL